jgi:hypothetical protein
MSKCTKEQYIADNVEPPEKVHAVPRLRDDVLSLLHLFNNVLPPV